MPGFRPAAYLTAPVVMLSLMGCVEPSIIDRSPDGVTLRWYSGTSDDTQARAVARAYCTGVGKSLELGGLERDGSALIARYRCV